MAKQRTINEIRQTKEYYTGNDPVQQVLAQQIEELAERDHQENLDKASAEGSKEYQEWANKANKSEEMKESRDAYQKQHIKECPLDPVEEAKVLIVNKITKHFHDVMFEMVNEEMSKCYLFQTQNYFTDAGYELFEDEYFEFYHTHHGDILYEVMQNITN